MAETPSAQEMRAAEWDALFERDDCAPQRQVREALLLLLSGGGLLSLGLLALGLIH